MKTVDDLRASLAAHAPAEDAGLLDRVAAVHSRVRVVRRRRRVSAAAALAAVVAVTLTATMLPRRGDEVVRYAGMPATLTSGGFEYRLAQSGELDDLHRRSRFDLVAPKDGRPVVAVITAEHLGGGTATLIDPNGVAVARLVGSGVSAPVPVYPLEGAADIPLAVQVSGAGPDTRVAVGGYRRTAALPKGVVDPSRSTVFRERVAARTLKVVEHDGRLWQLDRTIESNGRHELSTTWHELSAPLLLGYATEGTRRVSTDGSVPGGSSYDAAAPDVADSRASSLTDVLLPSTRADPQTYIVRWPAKYTHASGAILVYRPLG